MDQKLVVEVLFGASAVIAALATNAKNLVAEKLPRLVSIGSAVCLAAAAFFVQVSDVIH